MKIENHVFQFKNKSIFCPFYELDIVERGQYAIDSIEKGAKSPIGVDDDGNPVWVWYPRSYEDRIMKVFKNNFNRNINIK